MTRLTHFYDWEKIHADMTDCVLDEFALNGAATLTLSTSLMQNSYANPNFAAGLLKAAKKAGVTFTDAHGLWGGLWDLCADDPVMRKHLAAGHRQAIAIAAEFGVRTYTVHIGAAECRTNGGRMTDKMLSDTLRTLEAILPVAEEYGVVIAVENSFEPANTPEVVEQCITPFKGSPAIGCCFDVGHAHFMDSAIERPSARVAQEWGNINMWGGKICRTPFKEAIGRLAQYIVTCHVHDNDGWSDQHLLPGLGNCDFDEVFAEISKCPHLQSVQNETTFKGSGCSIRRACEVFSDLMLKLKDRG